MMDDMHDKNSENLNIRENLLEIVTTDVLTQSPSAVSASASTTGGCSVRGHKNCHYRVAKKYTDISVSDRSRLRNNIRVNLPPEHPVSKSRPVADSVVVCLRLYSP